VVGDRARAQEQLRADLAVGHQSNVAQAEDALPENRDEARASSPSGAGAMAFD
jgi:hypothetical protein